MSGHPPTRAAARALRGLHVLADDDPRWSRSPTALGEAACRGGAAVVQLRAKHARDREALAWARALRKPCADAGVLLFVNDRFDLALASGADGVHLGQGDLPPARIPGLLRERLRVGRSTHTLEQARRACDEPIDYLAFGPVFGTASKDSDYEARGLEALARVVECAGTLPVVAIGGIDAERVASVGALGAGAAVISAVATDAEPAAATATLARRLEEGRP